jgi:sarcosine oxidase subunit beta
VKRIVCTCEDITLEDIATAVRQGYGELETMKRYTGIGTGPCQGKQCLVEAVEHLARIRGTPPGEMRLPTIRQPILPLTMEQLASREKHRPEIDGDRDRGEVGP